MNTKSCCVIVFLAALAAFSLATPRAHAAQGPLVIRNGMLEVTFDPPTGQFSVSALQGRSEKKTFVKGGRFSGAGGSATIRPAESKNLGTGQVIVVTYPGGNRSDAILLFANFPFAVFTSTLHNGGATPQAVNRLTALTAPLDLGPPAQALRVLGTGGLSGLTSQTLTPVAATGASASRPAPKPDDFGSYVWLAVAEPQSRAGVVGAWLTQDRASGVVFPRVDAAGNLALEAQLHYGTLNLAPGQTEPLESFALGYFADTRVGLETWADTLARIYAVKLPPQPVGFCTWYMEKFAGASDEKHFAELADYAAKNLKPFGFDFVQIDDGWQAGLKKNGPKKNFTTHDVTRRAPYPGGMKATADKIAATGLTAGIWFMPFAGNFEDPFFADKMDLFVKTKDGKPYETSWGGTCLDMTNPKARDYLAANVRRIGGEWGYKLFKMDGLWTGTGTRQIYVNDGFKEDGMGDAVFHDPAMTNLDAFRTGLKTVRQAAGPGVFLLGCCVPQNMRSFSGALGLVDAMRIGPDTGSGHIGSPHATRQYFLNGRVWYNDPDCVSVRAGHPLGNARANASFAAISGDLYYNSDWIPDLPAERLEILKRTMLPHGLKGRPVDLFERNVSRIWLLSDTRQAARRDVVALFNWDTKSTATIESSLEHIGLDPKQEYVAFDFWANKFLGTVKDKISMAVPADSCVILALRPVADHPQLLSTSFHVTQGMVDVTGEKWDAATMTLSGGSKLVENDPCELRIAVPAGWKYKEISLLPSLESRDTLMPQVISTRSEPGLLRATLTAKSPRGFVGWRVVFTR